MDEVCSSLGVGIAELSPSGPAVLSLSRFSVLVV